MPIVTIDPILLPSFVPTGTNAPTAYTSRLIDAAGEAAALIFRPPKAGVITKVGFRIGAVPSAGDADVRLETVSATDGNPTGTLFGTTTNATQAISAANTWYTTTLTAGATVTRTDTIAAVVVNTTGQYNVSAIPTTTWNSSHPYQDHFASGAWTKNVGGLAMALEYNDGTYAHIPGVIPASSLTGVSYNNTSSPDERGAKFRFPIKVRAYGIWAFRNVAQDFDLVLYDSDGTSALATVTVDKDVFMDSAGLFLYPFTSSIELSANTFYRVAHKPTSASNVTLYEADAASVAVMAAMPSGADVHHTSRTDAGAWTDTTTKRAWMGIIVDGIDAAGGPLIGPGRLIR